MSERGALTLDWTLARVNYFRKHIIFHIKLCGGDLTSFLDKKLQKFDFDQWDHGSMGHVVYFWTLASLPTSIIIIMTQQETRRPKETQYCWEKILHKRENGFTMNTQKYHTIWVIVLWSNWLLSSQNIFLYLKMFCMQCRKNIAVEENKK